MANALITVPDWYDLLLTYHVAMHMLCSGTNVFLVSILVQPHGRVLDCFGFF